MEYIMRAYSKNTLPKTYDYLLIYRKNHNFIMAWVENHEIVYQWTTSTGKGPNFIAILKNRPEEKTKRVVFYIDTSYMTAAFLRDIEIFITLYDVSGFILFGLVSAEINTAVAGIASFYKHEIWNISIHNFHQNDRILEVPIPDHRSISSEIPPKRLRYTHVLDTRDIFIIDTSLEPRKIYHILSFAQHLIDNSFDVTGFLEKWGDLYKVLSGCSLGLW